MNIFASTFAPGFGQIVSDVLPKTLGEIKMLILFDGLIVYESSASLEKIKGIKFFNNSFLILKSWDVRRKVEDMVKEILPEILDFEDQGSLKGCKSYRVFASVENTPRHIHNFFLTRLEKKLSERFRLRVDRALPDCEFWFIVRSERYSFFGIRLTKKQSTEKKLSAGELRPEISHMLCLLADLEQRDVVLDPFAGYGGIVKALSDNFQNREIIAFEKDMSVFKILKANTQKISNIKLLNNDFFKTNETLLVNKVITDPPWGEFSKHINNDEFTKKLFEKLGGVVSKEGIVILLYGRDIPVEKYYKNNFKYVSSYDVLISGKKATVWKFIKV